MYLFYQDHPRPNVSLRRRPRAPAPFVSAEGMSFSLMCRCAFQHQNVKYLKSVFPSFAKLSRIVWVLLMFFLVWMHLLHITYNSFHGICIQVAGWRRERAYPVLGVYIKASYLRRVQNTVCERYFVLFDVQTCIPTSKCIVFEVCILSFAKLSRIVWVLLIFFLVWMHVLHITYNSFRGICIQVAGWRRQRAYPVLGVYIKAKYLRRAQNRGD